MLCNVTAEYPLSTIWVKFQKLRKQTRTKNHERIIIAQKVQNWPAEDLNSFLKIISILTLILILQELLIIVISIWEGNKNQKIHRTSTHLKTWKMTQKIIFYMYAFIQNKNRPSQNTNSSISISPTIFPSNTSGQTKQLIVQKILSSKSDAMASLLGSK